MMNVPESFPIYIGMQIRAILTFSKIVGYAIMKIKKVIFWDKNDG